MKNQINIGDTVRYADPNKSNYNNGRTGKVEAIQNETPTENNPLFQKLRYQVRWTKEVNGEPIKKGSVVMKNGVRTWVRAACVQLIEVAQ